MLDPFKYAIEAGKNLELSRSYDRMNQREIFRMSQSGNPKQKMKIYFRTLNS